MLRTIGHERSSQNDMFSDNFLEAHVLSEKNDLVDAALARAQAELFFYEYNASSR